MDIKEASRLAVCNMSDEEFLDMFYKANGINRNFSERHFLINEIKYNTASIIRLEEEIAELQSELEELKVNKYALIQKLKESVNCQ